MKRYDTKDRNLFVIDLLKGQGIPPKTSADGIILIMITLIIPVVISIFLCGMYLHSKVVTKIKRQEIIKIQENTAKFSDALKIQNALEIEKMLYKSCLGEVKTFISKYNQWSPVLVTLVEEIPDSVVLTKLEVGYEKIKQQIPKTGKPDKTDAVEKTVKKIAVEVSNEGQGDYGDEIKDFRNRLYASPAFGSKLESIAFSRKAEGEDGMETISYQIDCLFKPEF